MIYGNVNNAFFEQQAAILPKPLADALRPILPRHIARWKNLTMDKWTANVNAARNYARLRPTKIPELLKTAMDLSSAEMEQYFGEALRVLGAELKQ